MGANQPFARFRDWLGQRCNGPWLQLLKYLPAAAPSPSAEYLRWQNRFFHDRLGLSLWLALVILSTFIARDLYNVIFPLQELQGISEQIQGLWIAIDLVLTLMLGSCLALHYTEFGQRHPGWLLLGLSWSITISPQILAGFRGFPLPDLLAWSLVFLLQATLIPVRWELHLLSQVGLLGYFYGVNSLLGLTSVPATFKTPGESIFSLTILMYLFWFCFVCDLAVYLYERLQRAEFESRRQAQLFLHAVSHDLRNPVMGISLLLQSLVRKQEDVVMVPRSTLERMIESGDRQLNLINSLLEVYNSDIRGIALHPLPLALRSLTESVTADLEPLIQANQANLVNQISPALPLVQGDTTQLWRVLSNLIANALHHNPPGITLTLTATLEAEERICCQVQDNGVGMTVAESSRVFDLHVQGGKLGRSVGLGLGLYLCRQIIAAHGGTIGVTSQVGSGSTFWFTLPIAPSDPILRTG